MLEFINEHLPNIIAGLLPSLLVFAQSFYVLIKNVRVNHNFTNIEKTIEDLKKGELNVKDITDKVIPDLNNIVKSLTSELETLKDDLIEGIRRDVDNLNDDLNKKIQEQEALYQVQVKRLKGEIKRLKLEGDSNDVQNL